MNRVDAPTATRVERREASSGAAELAERPQRALTDFIATYNAHQAHPFTWHDGVRFYQHLKDKFTVPTQWAKLAVPTQEAA